MSTGTVTRQCQRGPWKKLLGMKNIAVITKKYGKAPHSLCLNYNEYFAVHINNEENPSLYLDSFPVCICASQPHCLPSFTFGQHKNLLWLAPQLLVTIWNSLLTSQASTCEDEHLLAFALQLGSFPLFSIHLDLEA